jgi:phosphoesterase RecJ-like protein
MAITLIEDKPNHIKISFRASDNGNYDVSKIAVVLGGGGHISAAGAKLNMTINKAIDKVVKTAKEIYNF